MVYGLVMHVVCSCCLLHLEHEHLEDIIQETDCTELINCIKENNRYNVFKNVDGNLNLRNW